MTIEDEDLSGKTILEVGSGRGDTTRRLVDLLEGKANAQLVATDISDTFFEHLRTEFRDRDVQIRFIRTGASELQGISDNSIDYLVCNYTLCAVNSQAGLAVLALRRFYKVLRPGGTLFIEEEFPISKQDTPSQEIWAEKWRILKAGMILAGQAPYNEFAPEILVELCRLAGFEPVEWTEHTEMFKDPRVLEFFQRRLDPLLEELPLESLRAGFSEMAKNLKKDAIQAGGMEIPFYRLVALKSKN